MTRLTEGDERERVEGEAKKARMRRLRQASAFSTFEGENPYCSQKSLAKNGPAMYGCLTKVPRCQIGVKHEQCQSNITL